MPSDLSIFKIIIKNHYILNDIFPNNYTYIPIYYVS